MNWIREVWWRIANLFRRERLDRELSAEIELHKELRETELLQAGANRDDAHFTTQRRFGNGLKLQEESRDTSGWSWLENLVQDVRFGARMLRKNSGFTAIAVLTLALGIGANTAIFSVIRGVLLKDLPFRDSSRIVLVRGTVLGQPSGSVSYSDYLDARNLSHSFEDLAAYGSGEYILSGTDRPQRVLGEVVSDGYFSVLGVSPILGRTFLAEEHRAAGVSPFVVIGYGLWQRAYGGDPAVIGRNIRVNNADFSIIGVMPQAFTGFSDKSELWIPIVMYDSLWPAMKQNNIVFGRDNHWLRMVGRLRSNVSLSQAQFEVDRVATSLVAQYPVLDRDRGFQVRAAHDVFVGSSEKPLLVLLGSVGFVLLIACANVVNLVLARMTSREREFTVRLALGAPRSRLVRQLLTECLLLASLGAALALVFVKGGMPALVSILPVSFPSFSVVQMDREVLLFTCVLMAATAGLLTLFPAYSIGRRDLQDSLKESGKGSVGKRGRRLNSALVISEVALTTVLLAGAGLLLKSFSKLMNEDPGFRPDHLVTMRFYVPDQLSGEARSAFGPQLAAFLSSVPGVQSAAVTFVDPFIWGGFGRGFTLDSREKLSTAEQHSITYQEIGPGYFKTMATPILQGREFVPQDLPANPHVLVVNEAFARRFWPGEDPIGKRIRFGADAGPVPAKAWMEVVGVAGNVKFESLRQDPSDSPVVYGNLLQSDTIMNMSVIVRTSASPSVMIPELRGQIQRFSSSIPIYNVASVEDRMKSNTADTRSYAILLGLFASLALALCAIGIYGVIAFWVAQRTREIGIRVALGASRASVLRLVAGTGLTLTLSGLFLGLATSVIVTRALRSLLYEVSAFDPAVFLGMSLLLVVVALLACWIPARRATKVDPMIALREE